VLRYWEGDIRRSPQAVADRLQETLATYVTAPLASGESTK
jgi:hypothetical protein